MNTVSVDDPDDPRVADYRHLTDVAMRRAREPAEGLFIVEGRLAIAQLLQSPFAVRSFLVTTQHVDVLRELVAGSGHVDPSAPVYVAGPDVMAAVAGFDVHRGLLASAARLPDRRVDEVIVGVRVVAVLEGINDHENVGAIFRSAAAFGVRAVLLDPRCCDPLYRRSVRVSMGHVLRIPFAVIGDWPAGLDQLRERGFTVLALTPDPAANPVDAIDDVVRSGEAVALLLGSEGNGLSVEAMAAADNRVRIPIAAGVDSLNVAAAAAIAFHHAFR